MSSLAERIDALLPQTQCRQCGYSGCRPYAEAVAAGQADINRCPPGGEETMRALARLAGRAPAPLAAPPPFPAVAAIDEARCIGCTLCFQACPLDAIVGAAGFLHTVIAGECSGCALCVPACPVDCIAMVEVEGAASAAERRARAARYRRRYEARRARLESERAAAAEAARERAAAREKRATIAAAVEEARRRLAARDRPRS